LKCLYKVICGIIDFIESQQGVGQMSLDWNIVLFAFGAILLVMVIVIAVLEPNFTPSQQNTFQIVLALASALIATAIPGFLEIKSEVVGLALQAGGAIAVFVFVYWLNPLATRKPPPKQQYAKKQDNREAGPKPVGCLFLTVLMICVLLVFGTIYLNFEKVIAQLNDVVPIPLIGNRQITINKTGYSSNVDGFTVMLTNIEFLEDSKKMRWNFQFWNQSTSEQNLSFNYAATYLTDGSGNRYPVIGTDTGVNPNDTFSEKVQAGVRVNHWLEFSTPIDNARLFNVVLTHAHLIPHFGGVEFPTPIFVVNLDEY
jgi:hypothetical protein